MSDFTPLFRSSHRYLISYTAYAGEQDELEIQGEHCRLISDRALTGREIANEVAHHIQEQDGIPVRQVVLREVGLMSA